MNTNPKVQIYFFAALLLAVSVLMFFVFSPFLSVLALAAILSLAFQPLYLKILRLFKFESLSSIVVIVLLAIFIVIPLALLSWQIFQEAQSLYVQISGANISYLNDLASFIEEPIRNYIPGFSIDLGMYTGKLFNWLIGNVGPVVSGTTQTLMNLFLVIIALFFFLKDGDKLKKVIVALSPLEDKYDNLIVAKMESTVNSVVKGTLLIAAIQGLIAGIGFLIFGVPSPTLWGTVGVVASLVPGIGTAIVIVPGIIYLFVNGSLWAAVGLAIWGSLMVGPVDQILRPFLYKNGVMAHPIFILFSVLGGLSLFGPLGIVFGPIILSLFLTLLDIYKCFHKPNQMGC